jgi:deoxyribonuclease V
MEEWIYPKSISDAHDLQKKLAQKIDLRDSFKTPITHIGGMDISNTPFDPEERVFAAVVVLSYPSLEVVESQCSIQKQTFPYIPGLLGFRETPALIEAYQKLSLRPDLIMVDGHGISHPRGLGIASHIGAVLDIPTIGVAKSILIGKPAAALPDEAGSQVPLLWKGEEIGRLIRTKKRCSPLIISAGHKISLETAVQLVLSCLRKYRLPETTRNAHLSANLCRKNYAFANQ